MGRIDSQWRGKTGGGRGRADRAKLCRAHLMHTLARRESTEQVVVAIARNAGKGKRLWDGNGMPSFDR